jgi:polysaccharide biosynthesis/export protein
MLGTRRLVLIGAFAGLLGACGGAVRRGTLADVEVKDYRLGPGDKLRITVFGEDDLTGEYLISPQGEVAFPLIGNISAQGLTVSEFAQSLTNQLNSNYLRQANVSIEVLNYRPFFILGEVKNAGTYPYSAGLTVLNAVATAGGFTVRANTERVYIKHAGELNEAAYRLTAATPVLPGDTIRFSERRF